MTPFQEKVFRAAARASKRTGTPVTTHSDARRRGGERQAAIFEQEGLDPRMVCIGHSDESASFDDLAGLARRGYTLGIDHLFYGLPSMGGGVGGSPLWQDRAMMVKRPVDAGFGDRIFLATDWFFALTIAPTEALKTYQARNPSGNLFNIRNTIPYLRQAGVSEAQIRTITVTSPRKFFARAQPTRSGSQPARRLDPRDASRIGRRARGGVGGTLARPRCQLSPRDKERVSGPPRSPPGIAPAPPAVASACGHTVYSGHAPAGSRTRASGLLRRTP